MKLRQSFVWFAGLLFAGISAGWAAPHTVMVGGTGDDMTFVPPTLTINAGDTVTFTRAGSLEHNVQADDNSFRCANGCDDSGGNGDVSAAHWSFTRTFSTPGTIGFYCFNHGAPGVGMHGSLTVNAVTPPTITIGGYISGNWYNPQQAGQGFQIEAATNNNMVVIWFVYSPDGTQQNWIYSQGAYVTTSNTVTLPAVLLTGAKFPPNFVSTDVTQTPWGTLTFTFTDCNNGTASWHSDLPGYNNNNDTPLAISRLTQIDGTTCPQ